MRRASKRVRGSIDSGHRTHHPGIPDPTRPRETNPEPSAVTATVLGHQQIARPDGVVRDARRLPAGVQIARPHPARGGDSE